MDLFDNYLLEIEPDASGGYYLCLDNMTCKRSVVRLCLSCVCFYPFQSLRDKHKAMFDVSSKSEDYDLCSYNEEKPSFFLNVKVPLVKADEKQSYFNDKIMDTFSDSSFFVVKYFEQNNVASISCSLKGNDVMLYKMLGAIFHITASLRAVERYFVVNLMHDFLTQTDELEAMLVGFVLAFMLGMPDCPPMGPDSSGIEALKPSGDLLIADKIVAVLSPRMKRGKGGDIQLKELSVDENMLLSKHHLKRCICCHKVRFICW